MHIKTAMSPKLLQKKLLKKPLAINLLPPKYIKFLNPLRRSSKVGKEGENEKLHGGLFIQFLSGKFCSNSILKVF